MKQSNKNDRFYGWFLLVVGFVVYGLGIAPAYYSWGFIAPEIMGEIDLSREQVGGIFGSFTLTFALTGPLAALAIRHLGLRVTVTAGAIIAAFGFFLVSRATSVTHLYLSYSLIGGVGIGLSTVFTTQTLAVFWFKKYRARAIAVTMLGAAIIGAAVTPIDDLILRRWDWRTAWLFVSATSIFVALISAVFIRNRPEDLGQLRDGAKDSRTPEQEQEQEQEQRSKRSRPPEGKSWKAESSATDSWTTDSWTTMQALRTPQFLIATLAAMANVIPWRVLTAHGRLHFEDLGFAPTAAAAILGVRVGVSAFGRLSGSLGDYLKPTTVLALALVINGLGLVGLLFASSSALAYLSVVFLGVGYGAGFVTEPALFADFFGREAFTGTTGLRLVIIGIVGWIAPTVAGAAADQTGSYNGSIAVLGICCFAAAAGVLLCRRPHLRAGAR